MQESGEDNFLCPSFNNFGYLSGIAAKISDEYKAEEEENGSIHSSAEEEDFEFYPEFSAIEFTHDGRNKLETVFPVFKRDVFDQDKVDSLIGSQLKNLFVDERDLEQEPTSSSASSEVDDLETIPPGTYCVWKPKINKETSSPIKCKKSKSTGSVSKKWKLIDLLRRSNSDSDGKGSNFVFLTPKKCIKNEREFGGHQAVKVAGKLKRSPVAHPQAVDARNYRSGYEVDKIRRKSYLPYRQDLIGFFASVNGLSRTFHPF